MDNINSIKWTREELWKGCMIATIAHAIMVAHFPELSNEHSWDGFNYNVQDSAGTRGTITFHPKQCVAAFRNERSSRISAGEVMAEKYFQGSPAKVTEVARSETLQYLLDNVNGEAIPVITTAFWEEENKIYSLDTFDEMIKHGGLIIERQIIDINSAINSWADYYEMTDSQVDLLRSIYNRRVTSPTNVLHLSKEDLENIGTNDEDGLRESEVSFREINVIFNI